MKITFIKSAVNYIDYPQCDFPEVAICGRSNAGKSSFINALTQSKIAKTSSTPGKTRLLNFFQVGENYRIVDMPGYGFAARSGSELKQWHMMIETYMTQRPCLVAFLLVMDIRRKWTEDEMQLLRFSAQRDLPFVVVLNKSDKVNRSAQSQKVLEISKWISKEKIFIVSSFKKLGVKEVENFVFENWVKNSKDNV